MPGLQAERVDSKFAPSKAEPDIRPATPDQFTGPPETQEEQNSTSPEQAKFRTRTTFIVGLQKDL